MTTVAEQANLRGKSLYCVFLFPSVNHALKAEKILKARDIAYKLVPVPRQISSDCGVCLRVEASQQDLVVTALEGGVTWEKTALL